MTPPVRVAVIGLGLVSKPHLAGYRRDERCQLSWVCDVDPERAQSVASDLGVKSTTDYRDLLDAPDVDAVALLLPHPLHYQVALDFLAANKHVCVEKPLAVTEGEASETIAAAQSRDLTLCVAENTRFVTAYLRAKEIVDEGQLGAIRLVRGFIPDQILDEWADRSDPTQAWKREPHGCGAIIDCAPHMLYLLKWFFGDIRELQAFASNWVPEVPLENIGIVAGTMSSGIRFTMEFASITEYPRGERLEIYGSEATLIIDQVLDPPAVIYQGDKDHRGTPVAGVPYDLIGWKPESIERTAFDFIDAILGDHPPRVSPSDARYVVRLVERAYESISLGGKVVNAEPEGVTA